MANISKITLPNGSTYDIYDSTAIHQSDITALMDLKGTKASYGDLPQSNNHKGDVWLISDTGEEYIWDGSSWIKLGYDIQAASASHTHNVTVTGTNAASTVNGTISVPKAIIGTKYLKAAATQGTVTQPKDEVLGSGTTFTTNVTPATTNIKATASGTAVGANGTAAAITTLETTEGSAMGTNATFTVSGGTATTSKMAQTTIKNPTVEGVDVPTWTMQDVSIPNVTSVGSVTAGSAASWEAKVESNVLKFNWTTNTPTAVTMPTLGTAKKATLATAGNPLSVSKVTTSNVTVATGALSSSGSGASVATGISAISVAVGNANAVPVISSIETDTTNVLTGVKVTAQPTIALATGATAGTGVISVATGISSATTVHNGDDKVNTVTSVSVGNPTVTLSESTSSGDVSVNTVSNSNVNVDFTGTAAAQVWKQTSGQTDAPNNG